MPRMGSRLALLSPPGPGWGNTGHTLRTVLPSGGSAPSDSQPLPSCPLRLVHPGQERSSTPGASSGGLLAADVCAHGAPCRLGPGRGQARGSVAGLVPQGLTLDTPWELSPTLQPRETRSASAADPARIFKVPAVHPPPTHTLYISRHVLRHRITYIPPGCELLRKWCLLVFLTQRLY